MMSRRVGVTVGVHLVSTTKPQEDNCPFFQCQRTHTILKGEVGSQAYVYGQTAVHPGPQRRHIALVRQTPLHLVLIIRSFSLSHGVQLATRGKPVPSIPAVQHRRARCTRIGCGCLGGFVFEKTQVLESTFASRMMRRKTSLTVSGTRSLSSMATD